jgi:hypothetical protein
MSVSFSPIRQAENLQLGGLYLPSVAFGFLVVKSSETGITIFDMSIISYFWAMVITLISAAWSQGFIESYTDSQKPGKPLSQGTVSQRMLYTVYNEGSPEDYPTDPKVPPHQYDTEIPKTRYLVAIVTSLLWIFFILTYPYTIWKLSNYALSQGSLLAGAIAFVQSAFILRVTFSELWPNTYLRYRYPEPDVIEELQQFGVYLRDEDTSDVLDFGFKPEEGGYVDLELDSESIEDLEEVIEFVILGYAGIIVSSDFPCQKCILSISQESEEATEYKIKTESVEEFREGERTISDLVNEIMGQTAE